MSGPLHDLSAALRWLHRQAGEPGTRQIGVAIHYSHTTVAQAMKGARCPSWIVVEKIVAYLDGDLAEFKRLWIAVRDFDDPLPMPTAPPSLPVELAPEPKLPSDLSYGDSERRSPVFNVSGDGPVIARVNPATGGLEFIMSPAVGLEWTKDLLGKRGESDG